jgi:uncharacterized RDD family membrane protein YckC
VTDPVETLAQTVAERVVEVVIQALDMNEIISRIDLTAALDQVDVDRLLDRVDVTKLLDRVDVDRLLNQVDVNGLVDRVDVDAILRRVDVDGLIDRVDVNGLIDRVDVDALVTQTDLGSILARSTSGVASEALDTLRGQTVMIDQSVDRFVWRAERRKGARPRTPSYAARDDRPRDDAPRDDGPPVVAVLPRAAIGPGSARPDSARPDSARPDSAGPGSARLGSAGPDGARPDGARPDSARPGSAGRSRAGRTTWTSMYGHYAGGASRLAAFVIDAAASAGAFTLALAAISYAASIITGHTVTYSKANWLVATAYVLWLFAYFAYPWSLSGKTLGMALLGVRVVAKDGTHAGWRRAVVRTLALPLSFLLFGLGLVGIVLQKQNRALHDFIAGTAVVYSWDARAARIRFLARTGEAEAARPRRERRSSGSPAA